MSARVSAPGRERDYDYSNVGKVGRRTGVTLAPRPLDEHGLEEITGLFSSPRKPSPAVNRVTVVESIESQHGGVTPKAGISSQAQTPYNASSTRRSVRGQSHPPPRSASPKKSGITGTARRSGAMDVLANKQLERDLQEDVTEHENDTQVSTTTQHLLPNARAASARPATIAKRFSPDRTPLRNRVLHQRVAKSAIVGHVSDAHTIAPQETIQDEEPEETPSRVQIDVPPPQDEIADEVDEEGANFMADDDQFEEASDTEPSEQRPQYEPELPDPPLVENDYSDEDQTFEPPSRSKQRSVPNKANSRRKRKSDALEEGESITVAISSPAAKRAKRKSDDASTKTKKKPTEERTMKSSADDEEESQPKNTGSQSTRGRKPLSKKDANTKISSQRQKELDDVVEKIRARPSAPKSLYILRRETPADDSVTHTRSGRISIKPLAFWRNERCVYSDTPNRSNAGIEEGARYPLNSIKEIVRSHELPNSSQSKGRKSKKSRNKGKARASREESDSELDLDTDGDIVDADADEWEINPGTLRGPVASWDTEHQTGLPDEPFTVDVAYAHAAIQTKDVKGNTFKYAKLLSSRFFGAGVVDIPGGGIKRHKNSRKMHMCFFVVQGRVTVRVGAMSGQEGDDEEWGTRFSVGKGGFWQVPRGNQYKIENEHEKTARMFFSQGCEIVPEDPDE